MARNNHIEFGDRLLWLVVNIQLSLEDTSVRQCQKKQVFFCFALT